MTLGCQMLVTDLNFARELPPNVFPGQHDYYEIFTREAVT